MVETASGPKVTVCMANYNGAAFIGEALASALEQTLANIEVIVVDDASTDDSVALAQAVAARDGRVRVERLARNGGPSAARNRVLELARGEWIAVLDSDDLMNPLRLQQLVDQAEATSADIIADDLLVFQQDGSSPPRTLLGGWTGDAGGWVSAADYIRSNGPYGHKPNLGFLKPLFRRSFLVAKALTYDISVRIGEDFDIVCRALLDGARMRILPRPYYLYRKHGASISQVMKVSHIQDMLSICDARRSLAQAAAPEISRAFADYRVSLLKARAYGLAIEALKQRRFVRAAAAIAAEPRSAPHLWMPIGARLSRLWGRLIPRTPAAAPAAADPAGG